MKRVFEQGATLRLELFTSDLRASLDFYGRVLGFEKEAEGLPREGRHRHDRPTTRCSRPPEAAAEHEPPWRESCAG